MDEKRGRFRPEGGPFARGKAPFGRNVLVTGVTSGIGRETALLLKRSGFHVWGVARHEGGDIPGIRFHALDVTDAEASASTIAEIDGEAVEETGSHLSILVSSAGMGITGSAERADLRAVRAEMEVNYFGTLTTVQNALPFLRMNERSLVVILSSVAGRIPVPHQGHYSSTKYALEAYGETLRMEAARFGVHVCLVEPGDTHTAFTRNRIIAEPKDSPYHDQVLMTTEKFAHDEQNGDSPEKVARAILSLTRRKRTPVRKAIGFDSKCEMLLIRLLPSSLIEALLKKIYF